MCASCCSLHTDLLLCSEPSCSSFFFIFIIDIDIDLMTQEIFRRVKLFPRSTFIKIRKRWPSFWLVSSVAMRRRLSVYLHTNSSSLTLWFSVSSLSYLKQPFLFCVCNLNTTFRNGPSCVMFLRRGGNRCCLCDESNEKEGRAHRKKTYVTSMKSISSGCWV